MTAARAIFLFHTISVAWFGLLNFVSANGDSSIHVWPGHRIQAAIDGAKHGQTIIVESGTYFEQLTIATDGIELVGHNAVLVPPLTPKNNLCSGLAGPNTEAAICIMGSGVELADFAQEHRKVLSVKRRVRGVSVTGFRIRGFSGLNIAIVGGIDTHVSRNTLIDGQQYGTLTVGSIGSRITHNTVSTTVSNLLFIGICMDDVANPLVANNIIAGYNVGLCIQTDGAYVHSNEVGNCCAGAFVDPGISAVQIHKNQMTAGNPNCANPEFNPGGFGVYGVIITGGVKTEVLDNNIEGQQKFGRPAGADWFAAGIAIIDAPPAIASDNVIKRNTLKNNDVDILVFSNGTGNVVRLNTCSKPDCS